jgi:hypothetical protein
MTVNIKGNVFKITFEKIEETVCKIAKVERID